MHTPHPTSHTPHPTSHTPQPSLTHGESVCVCERASRRQRGRDSARANERETQRASERISERANGGGGGGGGDPNGKAGGEKPRGGTKGGGGGETRARHYVQARSKKNGCVLRVRMQHTHTRIHSRNGTRVPCRSLIRVFLNDSKEEITDPNTKVLVCWERALPLTPL